MDLSFMISYGYFFSFEAYNPFSEKGRSTTSFSVILRSKYLEDDRGSMCFRAACLSDAGMHEGDN